ncbi:MAG: energy transducer TonB [Bacteroidales bacterium]|nr:energy transducer TonB [Bacteroidales bacterium]
MTTKTNNIQFVTLRLIATYFVALIIGWASLSIICLAQEPKTIDLDAKQEPSIRVDTIKGDDGKEHQVIRAVPEKEGEVFVVVEEPPIFQGGNEARIRFISENITYPEEARIKGIQGTVFVTFVIETDGSVANVRILRGIGGGCDEEAVRVVENMPKWNPGKQRGENVRVMFNMPIKFALGDKE